MTLTIDSVRRAVAPVLSAHGITHDSFVAAEGIRGRMERDSVMLPLRTVAEETALLSEGGQKGDAGVALAGRRRCPRD